MICIVTRSRLAGLQQDLDQAHDRLREIQGEVDRAYAGHLRTVWDLGDAVEAADREADAARDQATYLQRALEQANAELEAARETVTAQAGQIAALHQDLSDVLGAVVLLHFGQLHSLHRTTQAAEQHAQSLGASPSWGPHSGRPASEVSWRICSLASFAVPEEGETG